MFKFRQTSKKPLLKILHKNLHQLDLFGEPPSLRVFKGSKSTSSIGLFCTISLITITSLYAVVALQQLFIRTDPQVFSTQFLMMDSSVLRLFYQPFPLQIDNYTLAVTITNSNSEQLVLDDRYFTIKAQQCTRLRITNQTTGLLTVNQTCVDYPLEPCTNDHFVTETQLNYFSRIKLGTVQCFKKDSWLANPPVVQSYIQGMVYKQIWVTLSACKNTTDSNNCAPQVEIDKLLSNGNFAIHQSDFLLRHNSLETPFEEVITLQSNPFSITASKSLVQSLQVQTVQTDSGIIMPSSEQVTSLVQSTLRETQAAYNGDFILRYQVRLDNKSMTYQRTYIKLQTILGTLGGFYSILFMVIQIFIKPIQQIVMNVRMANKLFRFDYNKNDHDSGSNEQIKVNFSNESPQQLDITNKSEIKRYIRGKQPPISLTFKNVLKMVFGFKKQLNKQLEYATYKYQAKLDIAYLISKIYEIDKLKFILLNEQQQQLFDYIPKPAIPSALFESNDDSAKVQELEQIFAYKYILQEEKDEAVKIQEALIAYHQIMENPQQSKVDQRVLQYMDQDMLSLFKTMPKDKLRQESAFKHIPIRHSVNASQAYQVLMLPFRKSSPDDVNVKMSYDSDLKVMYPRSVDNSERENFDVASELR